MLAAECPRCECDPRRRQLRKRLRRTVKRVEVGRVRQHGVHHDRSMFASRESFDGWRVMFSATGVASVTAGASVVIGSSPPAPMIIPAATVRSVPGSTRMKLPVVRFSR